MYISEIFIFVVAPNFRLLRFARAAPSLFIGSFQTTTKHENVQNTAQLTNDETRARPLDNDIAN